MVPHFTSLGRTLLLQDKVTDCTQCGVTALKRACSFIFCLYVCVYLYACVFIKGSLTYVMHFHQINYVICIKEAALNRKYHGWVTYKWNRALTTRRLSGRGARLNYWDGIDNERYIIIL